MQHDRTENDERKNAGYSYMDGSKCIPGEKDPDDCTDWNKFKEEHNII